MNGKKRIVDKSVWDQENISLFLTFFKLSRIQFGTQTDYTLHYHIIPDTFSRSCGIIYYPSRNGRSRWKKLGGYKCRSAICKYISVLPLRESAMFSCYVIFGTVSLLFQNIFSLFSFGNCVLNKLSKIWGFVKMKWNLCSANTIGNKQYQERFI